jgi:hypothetical protein
VGVAAVVALLSLLQVRLVERTVEAQLVASGGPRRRRWRTA